MYLNNKEIVANLPQLEKMRQPQGIWAIFLQFKSAKIYPRFDVCRGLFVVLFGIVLFLGFLIESDCLNEIIRDFIGIVFDMLWN